jgi:uncharacterized protein (TIGR02246 family)
MVMFWKRIVLVTLLAFVVSGLASAEEKAARREADRAAIDQLTKEMVQAFEKRDAAALASHWTEGGEFLRHEGEPVQGRAAIQQGYVAFFKTLQGKPKLELQMEALRFPSASMAVCQAKLRLKNEDGETVASGRQDTVLVREDGQWKLAVVREWDTDARPEVSLHELEWLVGTWQAVTKDRAVTITYAWDEHKAFLRGTFTVKEGTKVLESGSELIGKDPAEGVLRSWLFQSDGGFASGVWTRDGKKWSVAVQGVRADGKPLTATTIYAPLNPHTVTWQAVNQTLGGASLADTPPIKVTKQPSAP